MNQLPGYEFDDSRLYTERAVDVLEGIAEDLSGRLSPGDIDSISNYSTVNGELEAVEMYFEELQPYHEALLDAYREPKEFPRIETIMGRIEEDMDLMARQRDEKLDMIAPGGFSRRKVLDELFESYEFDRPVLADTWIIMNEAERLREGL